MQSRYCGATLITFFVLSLLVRLSIQQDASSTFSSDPAASTQSGTQTCYDFNGLAYPNNTQCTGSFACCNSESDCTPDRLCKSSAGTQLVRATCAQYPWKHCANICLYGGSDGFLPRVNVCQDGSYCCDNDPACCTENRGIVMDGSGNIVSTNGGTSSTASSSSSTAASSSSTSTTTSSSSSSASSTSASTPLPSSSSSSSGGLSTGAKAGIAVGVIVGVLIAGILGFMLMRNQQRIKRLSETLEESRRESQMQRMVPMADVYGHASGNASGNTGVYKYELPQPPVEMPGNTGGTPKLGGLGIGRRSRQGMI